MIDTLEAEVITSDDWMPKDEEVGNYPADFVAWIDSINSGFKNRLPYKRFDLYCKQADQWLSENKRFSDCKGQNEQFQFAVEEFKRIQENSIYFLDKYLFYKTGSKDNKYLSDVAQRIAAFLVDSGYCLMIGKGRQIWFSTTIGGIALKRVNFNSQYFVKFIAENQIKAQEIFDDKIKFTFYKLEDWMKSSVQNDQDGLFKLAYKYYGKQKGKVSGADSKILVEAPYATAINGGAPDLVLMDEIGQIKLISDIVGEGRPTLYQFDRHSGGLKRMRQLVMWGCVCAGTKVWNNKGELINIEDLKKSDGVIGYNGKKHSKGKINWLKPPEKKPCYRIETTGNNFIECSYDHPLLSSNRSNRTWRRGNPNVRSVTFKKAADVKIGDQLVMLDEVPVFGKKTNRDARLIGLLIGDGNYSQRSNIQLSVADQEIREFVKGNYKTSIHKSFALSTGKLFESVGILGFTAVLRRNGMYSQVKDLKRLPNDIHTYDEHSVCELIAGYFDAYGNITHNKKSNNIKAVLSSTNEQLLIQVKFLLQKLGIGCCINKEFRSENEIKLSAGQKPYIFRLYVSRHRDVLLFQKKITLLCKHKQDVLDGVLKLKKRDCSFNNGAADYKINEKYPEKGEYFNGKTEMSKLRYERISKITYIGEKEIYNLNVSETHTYLANGFITANTGGKMERGGAEMEVEYSAAIKQWNQRDFAYGIVPVFFDFWARPGMTQQHYDREKKIAYWSGMEDKKVMFHQHYPASIADMFLSSADTLIPISQINSSLQRIYGQEKKPVGGSFVPIYDMSRPLTGFVPYAIKEVNFVPSGDATAPVFIMPDCYPELNWINRYYQGTDPINSQSGNSLMASAIWDQWKHRVCATLNSRSHDYRNEYLQAHLMNIFFGRPPHLIEINVGRELVNFIDELGGMRSVVVQAMLPESLKVNSAEDYGIRKMTSNTPFIHNRLIEMLESYKDNIDVEVFFQQLKKFVKKDLKDGKTKFDVTDYRYAKSDMIYGILYSYICAQCYAHREPKDIENKDKKKKYMRFICNAETGYNNVRREIWK